MKGENCTCRRRDRLGSADPPGSAVSRARRPDRRETFPRVRRHLEKEPNVRSAPRPGRPLLRLEFCTEAAGRNVDLPEDRSRRRRTRLLRGTEGVPVRDARVPALSMTAETRVSEPERRPGFTALVVLIIGLDMRIPRRHQARRRSAAKQELPRALLSDS